MCCVEGDYGEHEIGNDKAKNGVWTMIFCSLANGRAKKLKNSTLNVMGLGMGTGGIGELRLRSE